MICLEVDKIGLYILLLLHLWHKYCTMVNQVMTSTYSIGTIGSVASLLVATLYQGNHDMNHKYGNIGSIKSYMLHIQVLLECCYIQMESLQWENWNHLFCSKISTLNSPHCQFPCVGHVSFCSLSFGCCIVRFPSIYTAFDYPLGVFNLLLELFIDWTATI
jgi:hypothetical protein